MYEPAPRFAEHVFFHESDPSETPLASAVVNPKLGLGLVVEYDSRALPYLIEWKQMGFGEYAVGLEPGNCVPEGRVAARENNRLVTLEPGQTQAYYVGFRVLASRKEIEDFRTDSK